MAFARIGTLCLALAVPLAGCGSEGPAPAPSETAAAVAAPDQPPGIALSDARVQLPVISGRPGAAYVTVSQANGAPRSIAAVHVAGAGRAELHDSRHQGGVMSMAPVASVPLGAGTTVRFAPGGLHVMLFDVDPMLKPGSTTELTVTFDDGDKATIEAAVTAAGTAEARP